MQQLFRIFRIQQYKLILASVVLIALSFVLVGRVYAQDGDSARNGRLITFHDRDNKRVILTHAATVGDALKEARIPVTEEDTVEPKVDSELIATNYVVNIYRARPVIVVDGMVRQKVMTAAQTPRDIVGKAAVSELRDEDKTVLSTSADIATEGASIVLTIERAKPVTLLLYGVPTPTYSLATTVGEMLKQKGIKLASNDTLSAKQSDALTSGMTVSIWRNGVQTATVDEAIAFPVRQIMDVDQPIGYRKIETPGTNGSKSMTYEITAQGGIEVGRKAIQSVTLVEPKEQVEVVGAKGNGLTKSKGAGIFTDSKGVSHRETYYDLNMSAVMGFCGGGTYAIRADGAKIDRDGYVLIAANLAKYPRCSVVETSIGKGRVYDTGGFVARYPTGYDLATDWTNNDGR